MDKLINAGAPLPQAKRLRNEAALYIAQHDKAAALRLLDIFEEAAKKLAFSPILERLAEFRAQGD